MEGYNTGAGTGLTGTGAGVGGIGSGYNTTGGVGSGYDTTGTGAGVAGTGVAGENKPLGQKILEHIPGTKEREAKKIAEGRI
jgi:hypothetical protein